MLIFGFKTSIVPLAILNFICGNCGNPAAHHVRKRVTKFELFFIPLFPVSTKYLTECTFCGAGRQIQKEEADQLVAQAESGQAHLGQGGYGAQQPGHPQQPAPGQGGNPFGGQGGNPYGGQGGGNPYSR